MTGPTGVEAPAVAGPPAAHIRIPNRLYEALLVCGINGRQFHICHGLLRVTAGWGRKTVRIGLKEFAALIKASYGGSFREQMQDLIREGVVHVDRVPVSVSAYSLNPDHTSWGIYSVSLEALARRFGERPTDSDDFFPRQESEAETELRAQREQKRQPPETSAQPQAPSISLPTGTSARVQADGRPEPGPNLSPSAGRPTPSNSLVEPNLEARKDRKDRKDITATAADDAETVSEQAKYCTGIATAANLAISKKWGEQTHPIYFGACQQLAADLITMRVPLELARSSIAYQVDRSKNTTPPKSIEYFRPGILQSVQSDEQKAIDADATPASAADPAQPQASARTQALVAQTVAMLDRSAIDREMVPKFERERDRAAAVWAEHPAHAARVAAIRATAESSNGFLGPKWVERTVRAECAKAAGFPDYETWLAPRVAQASQAANVPRGTLPESK